jgi:multiple sugar transport system permease protein
MSRANAGRSQIRVWANKFGLYAIAAVMGITVLFPFYWLFATSFEAPQLIYSEPITYVPQQLTLENYVRLFDMIPFARFYLNSAIVAAGSILLALIIASFAGYSFARGSYTGKQTLTITTIVTQFLPRVLLLIPLFFILQAVGLINSLLGLMVTYLAFALPFSTLILKAYFESLPPSLEEAAIMDGCSRIQAFYRVILPLSKPGLIAAGTYSFVVVWQELMFALTLANDPKIQTLPVGLLSVISAYDQPWEVLFAGGVLATIPPIIIFMGLQGYLIQGMTAGAVKE